MSKREYRQALVSAKRELEGLLRQRQTIDERMAQLQPIIRHLESLCQDLDQRQATQAAASRQLIQGLTQEISNTLKNNYLPMSPRQVMEDMAKRGFDFKSYSNSLASVHTVLRRLVKAGKVEIVPKQKGKKEYQWKRTLLDLLEGIANRTEAGKVK